MTLTWEGGQDPRRAAPQSQVVTPEEVKTILYELGLPEWAVAKFQQRVRPKHLRCDSELRASQRDRIPSDGGRVSL